MSSDEKPGDKAATCRYDSEDSGVIMQVSPDGRRGVITCICGAVLHGYRPADQ